MDPAPIDLPFLAGMAHELRTPLAAIGGYAELLEHGMHGPVTPAQADALRRIKHNQKVMIGLIASVLEYAEAATGGLELERQPVPLNALMAAAGERARPALEAKALTLTTSAAPELPHAAADPQRTQQALDFLLQDAVRNAPPGSAVQLDAQVEHDALAIVVRSAGTAVEQSQYDAAFAPFGREGRVARGGQELSLPMARTLSRAMGGDVLLLPPEDELPRAFVLRLPRA